VELASPVEVKDGVEGTCMPETNVERLLLLFFLPIKEIFIVN
jgi:hypothetical protein